MISRIEGKIVSAGSGFLVVDVSGVGYRINIGTDTLAKIKKAHSASSGQSKKEKVSLWTHLAVRENAMDLYGFLEKEELAFFEMLIDISGIGPKSALGILGLASMETLRKAIGGGDTSYLTKVSGIGKKTAEKIVLELRDKLSMYKEEEGAGGLKEESDVLEALHSLGYSTMEARETLKQVDKSVEGTSERVRAALKILSKG